MYKRTANDHHELSRFAGKTQLDLCLDGGHGNGSWIMDKGLTALAAIRGKRASNRVLETLNNGGSEKCKTIKINKIISTRVTASYSSQSHTTKPHGHMFAALTFHIHWHRQSRYKERKIQWLVHHQWD
jgi:hypothetical protein